MIERINTGLVSAAVLFSLALTGTCQAGAFQPQPTIENTLPVTKAGWAGRNTRHTPREKLERLLRPHIYQGQRVSRSVREAAGPGTVLLRDERIWGEPAQCSFMTYRGKRAIICEAI